MIVKSRLLQKHQNTKEKRNLFDCQIGSATHSHRMKRFNLLQKVFTLKNKSTKSYACILFAGMA